MKSLSRIYFSIAVLAIVNARNSSAATLYESGTLGPTGIQQGSVAATNINPFVYTGVRFQLTRPVITSQVGGHFVSSSNGTFFGAIVELDAENDFPDSGDLSTSDVLGAANLTFPTPSAEVFGDLAVSLDPGWYALVFGSGLFGTSGDGAAPQNNTDIGAPSYIAFQPLSGVPWIEVRPAFNNHRFVIHGVVIPEPSSLALFSIVLLLHFFFSLRNRK